MDSDEDTTKRKRGQMSADHGRNFEGECEAQELAPAIRQGIQECSTDAARLWGNVDYCASCPLLHACVYEAGRRKDESTKG